MDVFGLKGFHMGHHCKYHYEEGFSFSVVEEAPAKPFSLGFNLV